MILARISDQDWHLRVLIEDLLDAAVIDTLPRVLFAGSAIVGFFRVCDVVRRVEIGITAGRWSGIMLVHGY